MSPLPGSIHGTSTVFSRLIDAAHAGETILVAKDGKPWARLVPLETDRPRRQPGLLRGQLQLHQAPRSAVRSLGAACDRLAGTPDGVGLAAIDVAVAAGCLSPGAPGRWRRCGLAWPRPW